MRSALTKELESLACHGPVNTYSYFNNMNQAVMVISPGCPARVNLHIHGMVKQMSITLFMDVTIRGSDPAGGKIQALTLPGQRTLLPDAG